MADTTPIGPANELPGDDVIPDAPVTMDRVAELSAPPEAVWPWLLQLGKDRAGWYLPSRVERFLPPGHRALRKIDARFQQVRIGDRVPDYGRGGWFEARQVEPPHALVWYSERGRDLRFSWALTLTPDGAGGSRFRARLRINRQIGRRAPGVVRWCGDQFDRITIALMVAGLRERLAAGAPR